MSYIEFTLDWFVRLSGIIILLLSVLATMATVAKVMFSNYEMKHKQGTKKIQHALGGIIGSMNDAISGGGAGRRRGSRRGQNPQVPPQLSSMLEGLGGLISGMGREPDEDVLNKMTGILPNNLSRRQRRAMG